jgi:hypothetical protein
MKGGRDMPFRDGRGPAGMGPMTGRGAGFCAGYPVPGYMNQMPGRWFSGFGLGHGGGRGHRNWFHATGLTRWQRGFGAYPYMRGSMSSGVYDDPQYASPVYPQFTQEERVDDLKAHAQYLKGMLDDINKQIESLETVPKAE